MNGICFHFLCPRRLCITYPGVGELCLHLVSLFCGPLVLNIFFSCFARILHTAQIYTKFAGDSPNHEQIKMITFLVKLEQEQGSRVRQKI